MESTPVENFTPKNFPHGEIWPPEIAGKIRFFAEKQPRSIAPGLFLLTR
jgi:hypothetical protein